MSGVSIYKRARYSGEKEGSSCANCHSYERSSQGGFVKCTNVHTASVVLILLFIWRWEYYYPSATYESNG